MAAMIWDTQANAFKGADTPMVWDAELGTYKDSTGLAYDQTNKAWVEKWNQVKEYQLCSNGSFNSGLGNPSRRYGYTAGNAPGHDTLSVSYYAGFVRFYSYGINNSQIVSYFAFLDANIPIKTLNKVQLKLSYSGMIGVSISFRFGSKDLIKSILTNTTDNKYMNHSLDSIFVFASNLKTGGCVYDNINKVAFNNGTYDVTFDVGNIDISNCTFYLRCDLSGSSSYKQTLDLYNLTLIGR